MGRYLIVAHQTAASPELIGRARARALADPDAEFTLLVPATHVVHLFTSWDEDDVKEQAVARARTAAARLNDAGVRVTAVRLGAPSPLDAVGDELREHPGYSGIILSTFPQGLSRWLQGDLPRKLRRHYALPVDHVVASSATRAADQR